MFHMPNDIQKLIDEYINRYGKRPSGFNFDEWHNLDEYKEYLEKKLRGE